MRSHRRQMRPKPLHQPLRLRKPSTLHQILNRIQHQRRQLGDVLGLRIIRLIIRQPGIPHILITEILQRQIRRRVRGMIQRQMRHGHRQRLTELVMDRGKGLEQRSGRYLVLVRLARSMPAQPAPGVHEVLRRGRGVVDDLLAAQHGRVGLVQLDGLGLGHDEAIEEDGGVGGALGVSRRERGLVQQPLEPGPGELVETLGYHVAQKKTGEGAVAEEAERALLARRAQPAQDEQTGPGFLHALGDGDGGGELDVALDGQEEAEGALGVHDALGDGQLKDVVAVVPDGRGRGGDRGWDKGLVVEEGVLQNGAHMLIRRTGWYIFGGGGRSRGQIGDGRGGRRDLVGIGSPSVLFV